MKVRDPRAELRKRVNARKTNPQSRIMQAALDLRSGKRDWASALTGIEAEAALKLAKRGGR